MTAYSDIQVVEERKSLISLLNDTNNTLSICLAQAAVFSTKMSGGLDSGTEKAPEPRCARVLITDIHEKVSKLQHELSELHLELGDFTPPNSTSSR